MSINVEEVTKKHNRKDFDCGVIELNNFLQQQAPAENKKTYIKNVCGLPGFFS